MRDSVTRQYSSVTHWYCFSHSVTQSLSSHLPLFRPPIYLCSVLPLYFVPSSHFTLFRPPTLLCSILPFIFVPSSHLSLLCPPTLLCYVLPFDFVPSSHFTLFHPPIYLCSFLPPLLHQWVCHAVMHWYCFSHSVMSGSSSA